MADQEAAAAKSIGRFLGRDCRLPQDFQEEHPGAAAVSEESEVPDDGPSPTMLNETLWGDLMARAEALQHSYEDLPREAPRHCNFLLLGPGGSGKTTVITNVLSQAGLRVAFCAFTNKATQVLQQIAAKHKLNFEAEFMTIHRLLQLEANFFNSETELAFRFDVNKTSDLMRFDLIVFDECSTISAELYDYLQKTWAFLYFRHRKCLKFLFLGDYWQLPPVGEVSSQVFGASTKEAWRVARLKRVMRSANPRMEAVNARLLEWVGHFRTKNLKMLNGLVRNYPFNLVRDDKKKSFYRDSKTAFYREFVRGMEEDPDRVILSFSRSNTRTTNEAIQDLCDVKAGRTPPDEREEPVFFEGDRCCIERPIKLTEVKTILHKGKECVTLGNPTGDTLYNGEIFEVAAVENTHARTTLNELSYIPDLWPCQVVTVPTNPWWKRPVRPSGDGAVRSFTLP